MRDEDVPYTTLGLSKYYDDGRWRCAVCVRRVPLNHAPQCPIPTLLSAADARLDLVEGTAAELGKPANEPWVIGEPERTWLVEAITNALSRERERCASVAEATYADSGWSAHYHNAGLTIAAALRGESPR